VVALDTLVIGADPHGPALSAQALAGFTLGRDRPFELVWQPRLPPDTTYLAIRSLSGVGWRLWLADDSLTGRTFEYWDLGPTETEAGPVRGQRVACP
jgi:hypothetical protein